MLLALAAVLTWSTSAPLMKLADPLSPFEKTVGRLLVGALVVALIARAAGVGLTLGKTGTRVRVLRRFVPYSAVAAAHWALFIAALDRTTIAHTLSIINTSPVFVAVLSATVLKEPVPREKWSGIVLAVAGVGILVGFEPTLAPGMLVGDLMALGSALGFAVYSIVGRYERGRTPLLSYAFAVWVGAALWSAPFAVLTASGAISPGPVLALVVAGILPFALGQILYNAALRRIDSTAATLIGTLEVVAAVAAGSVLFGEVPSPTTVFGVALTLFGVGLVIR